MKSTSTITSTVTRYICNTLMNEHTKNCIPDTYVAIFQEDYQNDMNIEPSVNHYHHSIANADNKGRHNKERTHRTSQCRNPTFLSS